MKAPYKSSESSDIRHAMQLYNAGDVQGAEAIYKRILSVAPNNPYANHLLGVLYHETGADRLAEPLAVNAARLNPQEFRSHYLLGNVLKRLGCRKESLTSYRQAIMVLDNTGIDGQSRYRFQARIYLEMDDERNACKHFLLASAADNNAVQKSDLSIAYSSCMDPDKKENNVPYIREFNDVILETKFWTLVANGRYYAAEISSRNYMLDENPLIQLSSADEKTLLVKHQKDPVTIEKPCILIGGTANYYHWLIDDLSRMRVYEQDPELAGLPLLVTDQPMPGYFERSLELSGFGDRKLIRVKRNQIIVCRHLFVSTVLTTNKQHFKLATDWLRNTMMPADSAMNAGSRNFYLSRSRETKRRLVNEVEIIRCLKKYDFESVYPQDYSLDEQIEMFSNANSILGPHGTALANMLWAPCGVKVLDLRGQYNQFSYLQNLARARGIYYKPLFGQASCQAGVAPKQQQDADFNIDPDKLTAAVDQLFTS